jgi:hypothetical protein
MEPAQHRQPPETAHNPHHPVLAHRFRFATRPLEQPSKQFASEILRAQPTK